MAKGVRDWVSGVRDFRSKCKGQSKGFIKGGFVSQSAPFYLVISVFKAKVKQVMFIVVKLFNYELLLLI